MVGIQDPSVEEKTLTVEDDPIDDNNEQSKEEVVDSHKEKEDADEEDKDADEEGKAEEDDDDGDDLENESDDKPKKMKKLSTKPRKYSITVRCSMNKVSQHFILGLQEKERTSFKNSCFGQFLKLQANKFRMLTPIVFEMVKRRVDRCKYRIGGKIMSFTPLDVTLILGLRIGAVPSEFVLRKKKDKPSAFRVEYFDKKRTINAKDIEEAIKKAKDSGKDTDVDRLNRLYLLPICLLPEKARNVDLRYIDLASDLEKFDNFPWGTVVYDCLADSLETVYGYVKEDKLSYGIHGCILAFIIWAYQHILTLGPRRDSNAEFPRMLGWRDLPAKCRKETTIGKLLDNNKGKKPQKEYLYYPRKPTAEEKTLEVVHEGIEWMRELEADAASESFTLISKPSSSSTAGNFNAEDLKNIFGMISAAVDVEKIAEELGKKFEIVPKKSRPKKKTTHKRKKASAKATPIAKKRKITPAKKKSIKHDDDEGMEYDEDEEEMEHVHDEGEIEVVQDDDDKEHDEDKHAFSKAVPIKRKRSKTVEVERRNQPYRETKGKDHSWKKLLTKKPRTGKKNADMVSHPEDILVDPVDHKPKFNTDDEAIVVVDPDKDYLITMEKLSAITKLELMRTGEESNKSPTKDCLSSPSKDMSVMNDLMSAGLTDKKDDDEEDNEEVDVVDHKVLELFNSDSEDVIKEGPSDYDIEVEIIEDPIVGVVPITKKRETERKYVQERRMKLFNQLDMRVGIDCDQQIRLTMTDAIFRRTTTNEESSWLDQVWKLGKKNPGYLSKTIRYYGHRLYLPYKDFCSLNEEEWLNDCVIDVYMKLLCRWYIIKTEDLADADRYSIVTSVFFATKCNEEIQEKFDTLMKNKDFKKADPKKRFEMGFSICNGVTCYVDIFDGLRSQPHPITTKALLVPLQVNGNHWVLLAFSFPEKTVRIYDSLNYKKPTKQQLGVERMLPYVVYAADSSCETIEFDFQWRRIFVPCAKQEDSSSCGAYMLAIVDCLLRNKGLKFKTRNELLRRRIAMDLLDCGVKKPQKPKDEELLKAATDDEAKGTDQKEHPEDTSGQTEDKVDNKEDKAEENVDDAKGIDV